MKKSAIILSLMLLSGCTFSDARPQPVSYPATLFVCPDSPKADLIRTDNELAEFIVKQDSILTICREKLKNVGELIQANQPKEKK